MSIRIGIVTISDRSSRAEREDKSGPALVDAARLQGWQVVQSVIIPDEVEQISATLAQWADADNLDVILTTGGTGFSPRDVTPEATQAVIQRPTPGIAEAMRHASLRITPHAMLSRAVAGIRSHTLIINLPGSPKAAIENMAFIAPILPHAVSLIHDDPAAEAGHRLI